MDSCRTKNLHHHYYVHSYWFSLNTCFSNWMFKAAFTLIQGMRSRRYFATSSYSHSCFGHGAPDGRETFSRQYNNYRMHIWDNIFNDIIEYVSCVMYHDISCIL